MKVWIDLFLLSSPVLLKDNRKAPYWFLLPTSLGHSSSIAAAAVVYFVIVFAVCRFAETAGDGLEEKAQRKQKGSKSKCAPRPISVSV